LILIVAQQESQYICSHMLVTDSENLSEITRLIWFYEKIIGFRFYWNSRYSNSQFHYISCILAPLWYHICSFILIYDIKFLKKENKKNKSISSTINSAFLLIHSSYNIITSNKNADISCLITDDSVFQKYLLALIFLTQYILSKMKIRPFIKLIKSSSYITKKKLFNKFVTVCNIIA